MEQEPINVSVSADLARAIIEMDDIAFSEGLGPANDAEYTAWEGLLSVAELVAEKEATSTWHRTWHRNYRKAQGK